MNIEEASTKSRRRAPRKKRNLKKIFLRVTAVLAVILILVGGYLGFKALWSARKVFKGGGEALAWNCEPDPAKLKGEGDGRINILLLGKGGPEQRDGPNLTDTIILSSIDPCNKEAGLLSIPRDLAVKMDTSEVTKINAVYALTKMSAEDKGKSEAEADKEAIEAIEKVIENITGVPVHYYVMIDFTAFENAVDAVGGVDIDVKTPVFERMSLKGKSYTLDVEAGQQHFDGLRALAYSRSRYTSARGDFDRSERQRELIIALRNKVLSVGTYSNPLKVSQLIDSFGSRVSTNLGVPDDIGKLYNLGQEIGETNIKSVSLVDEPNVLIGSGSYGNLGSIQIPKAGIFKYEAMRDFIRATFLDGFIKKENPAIVVLNGTTVSGLAGTAEATLKGYGYNVIDTADAPDKNTTSNILVDLRGGEKKYTRRYLELRYKTTAVSKLPDGVTAPESADFVIILGQNETGN